MHRLRFEKLEDAIYLSHLDLMRVMQRAFSRAGVMLKHSGGYSPKAYVSAALPLSVGVESVCELLDYELLDGVAPPCDLPERLNATLPAGVRVTDAYESDRKIRDLALLRAALTLEYDGGVPQQAPERIAALLTGKSLVVPKHTKRGETETDIRPLIRILQTEWISPTELRIDATVSAQEPSLNPLLLLTAIERYLPEFRPDFALLRRLETFDRDGKLFR